MGGAVFVGTLQLQYDLAGTVTLEPFAGDGRPSDIAAELLEFQTLIGAPAAEFQGATLDALRMTSAASAYFVWYGADSPNFAPISRIRYLVRPTSPSAGTKKGGPTTAVWLSVGIPVPVAAPPHESLPGAPLVTFTTCRSNAECICG